MEGRTLIEPHYRKKKYRELRNAENGRNRHLQEEPPIVYKIPSGQPWKHTCSNIKQTGQYSDIYEYINTHIHIKRKRSHDFENKEEYMEGGGGKKEESHFIIF